MNLLQRKPMLLSNSILNTQTHTKLRPFAIKGDLLLPPYVLRSKNESSYGA